MNPQIKCFISEWKNIRGKTLEFLETVPEERWTWKPHELLGTFGMQIRHIIDSEHAYILGMKNGKVIFDVKTPGSDVEKNKSAAITRLQEVDRDLEAFLHKADPDSQIKFIDGVYGEQNVSLSTVLRYLLDHEMYHQGILTCLGRLAGLGKFRFM